MYRDMKKNNEKGFTLLELFIVMIIIGIIAATSIPKMNFQFFKNKLRSSTSAVTASLYLARMKAVNNGEEHGVQFLTSGEFYIVKDPLGSPEIVGVTNKLDDGISFLNINFVNWLAVFSEQGQLEKTCLPTGVMTGSILLENDIGDSTQVDITFVSGGIREKNL